MVVQTSGQCVSTVMLYMQYIHIHIMHTRHMAVDEKQPEFLIAISYVTARRESLRAIFGALHTYKQYVQYIQH